MSSDRHFEGTHALRVPLSAAPSTGGTQLTLNAYVCDGQKLDVSNLQLTAHVYLDGPEFPAAGGVELALWGNGFYHFVDEAPNPKVGEWLSLQAALGPIMDNKTAYGLAIMVKLNQGDSWTGDMWIDAVSLGPPPK